MKLEFIRVINFRQFHGNQMVDFSFHGDLNVTVFHGSNGAGKTSLFSAINWCLYEEGTDNIGQLVSKEAVSLALDGENIPCVVSIGFFHYGQKYIAERIAEYKKILNKPKLEKKDFSLTQISRTGDSIIIHNPQGVMNSILPENVRPYFFFDGEKMDDLTKGDTNQIEDAVRNIMRLPTIERAQTHLQEIANEFRKEIRKKGSHELEAIIEREEKIRERKEKLIKRREDLKEEIKLAKQKIDDIEVKLRGTEATKELQNLRDSLQNRLDDIERTTKNNIRFIQKLINKNYILLLDECSKKTLNIVNQKREKGEIPSGIREQFIKDLLEKRICVCGREFSTEDEAYKHLYSLLKRTTSSKLENEVVKLGGSIHAISLFVNTNNESLNEECKKIAENHETSERLYAQLDDIKRKLTGTSIEEIVDLEQKRTKFKRSVELNFNEIGGIENELKNLENNLEDIEKQRVNAQKKEKELSLLVKKENFAQRAADSVEKIKDEFFETTRVEIEKKTKEIFSTLAWKQDHFQDVCLDQDFRLEVIDKWGTPTRKELSAGERQILSLSFITAMSNLSGEEAPLVMDTPFGRLSGEHLKKVAENLPNLTPQLILFVTDREWDEASRTRLEPKTGAQYDLCFDRKSGCTTIEEVCYE